MPSIFVHSPIRVHEPSAMWNYSGAMFDDCHFYAFTTWQLSVCRVQSSGQILLPWYLTNGWTIL